MELTDLSADALSKQLRSGELSAREVMTAFLDRIDVVNPDCNAVVSLRARDLLLAEALAKDDLLVAARADGRKVGWMHGMPQAIKDLADAEGFVTTRGSPLFRSSVAPVDSLMVARMKAAGCIVIGKTNTPEFGLGSHTFNEVFGVTRNPYDLTKSAGGSSGGAAVALATRMLPVADGSDYGGSLRNPAAWNNIFGFRPSENRVPAWPATEVWFSRQSTGGPMGRSIVDVANLLQIQAGHDARLPLSLESAEDFRADLDRRADTVRVGWLGDLEGYLPMEPGIVTLCERGLARLELDGCTGERARIEFELGSVWDAWCVLRSVVVGRDLEPLMGNSQTRALVKPEAQWEHEQSVGLSASALLDASMVRTEFYQHLLSLFDRFDVLAIPTAQVWPFDAMLRWPTEINGVAMGTYHRWMEVVIYATFAGLPSISVPVGFNEQGLPMGMQLIGRPRGDHDLLRLAYRYEQTIGDLLAVRPSSRASTRAR